MGAREAFDADAYWRQYEVKVSWDRPRDVIGTVEALRETRSSPTAPWIPRLAIRRDDGVLVVLDAYPTRLRAELVLAKPAIGDRIHIRYLGEDDRAAPGREPTKRFAVRTRPPGQPAPAQNGDRP